MLLRAVEPQVQVGDFLFETIAFFPCGIGGIDRFLKPPLEIASSAAVLTGSASPDAFEFFLQLLSL